MREVDHASFDFSGEPGLDLASLDEETLRVLLNKERIIKSFFAIPKKDRTVEKASQAALLTGLSVSQFYRRASQYRKHGLEALVPKAPSGGKGKARIDPEAERIIQKVLKTFLKKKRGHEILEFVEDSVTAMDKANLPAERRPSERCVARRFEALPEKTKVAHWKGRHLAKDQFDLRDGETPPCTFPGERVQIDHTRADICLVSETDGTVLGRPWVTMAIDEYSRAILAIWVTFREPQAEELAAVITRAALPKDRWLAELGLDHIYWPMAAMSLCFFTDRGGDFKKMASNAALKVHGGNWEFRPQPHYGGIVESLIKTAMKRSRRLKGASTFSKAAKPGDVIDPTKTACLTRDEFERELVQWFGETYHTRPHSGTNISPLDKWLLGVDRIGEPKKVAKPHHFYVDMLPKVTPEPTLQRYGFREGYLEYSHPDLDELLATHKSENFPLKIDPADVTRAFIRSPKTGKYLELRARELPFDYSVTREEWKFHQKLCASKASRPAEVGREAIIFSIQTGRLLGREAEFQELGPRNKKKRAVRKSEDKQAQTRKVVGEMAPPPEVEFEIAPNIARRDPAAVKPLRELEP